MRLYACNCRLCRQKFVNRITVVCAEVNIAFVFTEIQNIAESLVLVGCDRGEEVNSACVVEFQMFS